MGSTTVKVDAEHNRSVASGMPSFISSTPVSNQIMIELSFADGYKATEGNATHSSRITDFGVLEQYLGFHIGDAANVNRSQAFNLGVTHAAAGTDLQSGKSANSNLPSAIPIPQTTQLQKGSQPNVLYVPGTHHENWGESNMADSSSHTDTSTDPDGEDKNQRGDMGQSTGGAIYDSSDKSKEKNLDQKTLRRLAQNREAARKSRLRKKAYVQQLENSRLKLTQLEQELQRARQQGMFISSMGDQSHGTSGNGNLIIVE